MHIYINKNTGYSPKIFQTLPTYEILGNRIILTRFVNKTLRRLVFKTGVKYPFKWIHKLRVSLEMSRARQFMGQ